jgi:hypothetical protein
MNWDYSLILQPLRNIKIKFMVISYPSCMDHQPGGKRSLLSEQETDHHAAEE